MAKTALITDTHFGVRGNNDVFHDNMELFFVNVFFPYLKKEGIKRIIHLGDVFDNRRTIDIKTAKRAREYFFEPLKEAGIRMDVITGNHDLYKKETSDISTLEEFVSRAYDNITIYSSAGQYIVDGKKFLYVPWINKANREATMATIEKSTAKIVLGHFELTGANYSRVQVATTGDDPAILSKFDHVYSGHYHYKNTLGNITYLGSPTEHTWIDCGTKRGFHTIDDGYNVEFIENPYNIFEYVSYPGEITDTGWKKHFRVNVEEIEKQSDFDKFKKKLEEIALTVTVITPKSKLITDTSSEAPKEVNLNDSIAFMREFVEDDQEYDILVELYNKANSL